MPKQPVLFLGSQHKAVATLAKKLAAQGMWSDALPDAFTPKLEEALRYFQSTHLGPNGRNLAVDGTVGPDTWWALSHPSGAPQQSNLEASVPKRIGDKRTRLLEIALAEHAKNVMEVPNGSNRGPEVDKYLPAQYVVGKQKGPPWCAFFYSWVCKLALDAYPLGQRVGSCARARLLAGREGRFIPKNLRGDRPYPGDAFVMNHGGGQGHIGFVLRVSKDGAEFNTVEGNCGNRVKLGLRELADPEIVGFIDNVPDEQPSDFERGVVRAAEVATSSTR